ncbi:MAG: hypothetical protein JSS11_06380 [Verrucomicrobia bacterium]|nr:hypothetical protein [Verrucomicrobiota bacterium]
MHIRLQLNSTKLFAWCAALFALVLLVGILTSTRERIYDERYHLERVDELAAGRPWRDIFTEKSPSAVGPIFPLSSALIGCITPDVRAVRLFVWLSAIGVYFLTAFLLKQSKSTGAAPLPAALLLGCTPFVVSGALALTEMLALAFALGAFAMVWAPWNRLARIILSGTLFALAVLTRQTSLIFALPLAALWYAVERIKFVELILLAVLPTVALETLLMLWGGLTPPGQEHLSGGFSLPHVIQAGIYCAVMGCIINPGYVLNRWMLVALSTTLIGNIALGLIEEPVLLTLFPEHSYSAAIFSRAFFGAGIGLAFGYFFSVAAEAWANRSTTDAVWIGSAVLVIISCGAIVAQFSSRYVVAAIPFLLLLGRNRAYPIGAKLALALMIVGFLLGINALRGYALWV